MGAEVGIVNYWLLAPRCILIQIANALLNCPAKRAHRTCKFWRGGWGKQTLNLWYAFTLWPSSLISQEATIYDEILRRKESRTPGNRRGQRDKPAASHLGSEQQLHSVYVSTWRNEKLKPWIKPHETETASCQPCINSSYSFLTEPHSRKVWPCDQVLANET